MNPILKYYFSVIVVLITSSALFGQGSRYIPTAIKLGIDPAALGYLIFSEKRAGFEAEADIDIDRFFLTANYGVSSYKLNEPIYAYDNQGTYLRIGPDINFMHKDPHLNVAFFGFRYAMSSFSDKLDYDTKAEIQSDIGWPSTRETISNDNAKASWYELVTGLKIRVVKQLYLGFTLRFKLLMKVKQVESLRPYYIPGFGKNINTSSFAFNFFVSYRLPFRKKIIYE